MRDKSNNDYLSLQANIICLLLFFVAGFESCVE
jgi:hypothetical protein